MVIERLRFGGPDRQMSDSCPTLSSCEGGYVPCSNEAVFPAVWWCWRSAPPSVTRIPGPFPPNPRCCNGADHDRLKAFSRWAHQPQNVLDIPGGRTPNRPLSLAREPRYRDQFVQRGLERLEVHLRWP
ncbi:hypothetical protein GCM10009754_87210 [Amycolatopsis minnesotensis]|uniref:Uncharacterized protein n=1 Tax=Amycolatopsis minnesotensis TaxID=337894 RepID=A0ABP5EAF8_9PSEU